MPGQKTVGILIVFKAMAIAANKAAKATDLAFINNLNLRMNYFDI